MIYKGKEMREALGITQRDFAAETGICRKTIWELEHGKERNITVQTAHRIARALNADIDSIFVFNE